MDFRTIRIPYAGRQKYGNGASGDAIRGIIQNYFGGGGAAIAGGSSANPNGDYDNNRGKNASSFFAMLSKTANVFDKTNLPLTDTLQIFGYKDMEAAQVLVGDISTSAASPTWSLTGVPIGMNVQVADNGTRDTTISFGATTAITATEGDIKIPVAININQNDLDPSHYSFWFYRQNCMVMTLTYHWSVIDPTGGEGESAWYLSLDNDNASINCDSDGNIYPGAIRPTCHAKMYYGMTQDTGATYSIDYGTATGVSISTSQGVGTLNFGNNFNFTGDNLSIIVSGITSGEVRDVKIMNVTKSKDGSDGQSSVSYWLETSYPDVIYDKNTHTADPTSLSATAYMQVGEQAITTASGVTIKYSLQYRSSGSFTPESAYTGPITITSAMCSTYLRVRFILYKGQSQVDLEDVNILQNGVDGEGQVKQGPAIRGPYDYYQHSGDTRDWCNGASSSTISDSDKWIDVVMKDGTYYYCSTAYHGTPLGNNIANWTSGESFDFIATNLLLASAASINFLTGNEIYLRDSNGNITAGLAGGDGINFWAGAPDPVNAPFTIANDGTMKATQGMFQGTVSAATIYASDIVLDGNALKLFSSSANTFEISDAEIEVQEVPEDVTIPQTSYNYSSFDNTTSGGCAAMFTAMGDSTTIIPPHYIQATASKALDYHQSIVGTVELVCAVFSADSQNTYAYGFLNQQNMPYPDLSRAISSGSNIQNFSMTSDETYKDVTINASFDEAGGTSAELHLPCKDGVDYVVVFAWIQNGFQTQYLQQFTIDFPKFSFVNAPNPTDTQFFNIGSNGMQIFLGNGFYFTAARDRTQGPIIAMGGQNMSGQMFGLRLTRANGIQILTGKPGEGWHTPQ